MRIRVALLAATAMLVGTQALSAAETIDAKLRGELADVVQAAAVDELIPISIVLEDRLTMGDLQLLARGASKAQRRAAVIATLKGHTQQTSEQILQVLETEQATGAVGQRLRTLWIANVIATSATPDVIRQVAEHDDVAYINYDKPIGEEVFPVEPAPALEKMPGPLAAIECGVDLMRAPLVWSDYNITGDGVVVGIIDTGACITHPDLANQVWNNEDEIPGNGIDDDSNGYVDDVVGYNFHLDTPDVSDSNGHGTHTAGTVAGDGTNGTDTGMAHNAQMMILEFWNSFSGESVVWEAMQYAVDNDADVITASIGWPHSQGPDRATWRMSCESAIAAGVVVIYASGNEGGGSPPDNVRTPGDVPDVITIGATDCNMNIASFSSRGPVTWQNIPPWNDWPYPPGKIKPTVSAPGVDTVSLRASPCSGYTSLSGTSMATPHVAGAVALILEANPSLDHFDVKQLLKDTAIDRGPSGPDNDYGAGFVDAYDAVEMALNMGLVGDVNGDGVVNFSDLLLVLAAWGPCGGCPEDLNGDNVVDFADILLLLSNWS